MCVCLSTPGIPLSQQDKLEKPEVELLVKPNDLEWDGTQEAFCSLHEPPVGLLT